MSMMHRQKLMAFNLVLIGVICLILLHTVWLLSQAKEQKLLRDAMRAEVDALRAEVVY